MKEGNIAGYYWEWLPKETWGSHWNFVSLLTFIEKVWLLTDWQGLCTLIKWVICNGVIAIRFMLIIYFAIIYEYNNRNQHLNAKKEAGMFAENVVTKRSNS